MTLPHFHPAHQQARAAHVRLLGLPISDFSRHVVSQMASDAGLQVVHITSVKRTVKDQARTFYDKHVIEGKAARYKNPEVAKIIAHARELKAKGASEPVVKSYLISSIEHVHGGPASISHHLGGSMFLEVFDIAHYSGPTKGPGRHSHMTEKQAQAFLNACRKRIPYPIARLGHSAELGLELRDEFVDEKCFHLEIQQPVFDRLEHHSGTMSA
jgi:hypothetical protein